MCGDTPTGILTVVVVVVVPFSKPCLIKEGALVLMVQSVINLWPALTGIPIIYVQLVGVETVPPMMCVTFVPIGVISNGNFTCVGRSTNRLLLQSRILCLLREFLLVLAPALCAYLLPL